MQDYLVAMVTGSVSSTRPVVLVHGWAGSFAETWRSTGIDALLEDSGRTVVGIDLLGHGDADKPHDPDAYSDLSGWFLDRIAHIEGPVDAAGFSLGALTILGALLRAPERFGKVLLSGIGNGVFEVRDASQSSRIVDALEGRADPSDTASMVFARYADAPGKDKTALTAIMKRTPTEPHTVDQCARCDNEVLVVIGENDFTAPADALASAFPHGSLVVLKGVDHFATPESFAFIDALLDFFAQ